MNRTAHASLVSLLACLAAAPALAQSNVDPANKSSWGENVGWMNWRDAGVVPGGLGVRLAASNNFLSGWVWGENIGWINVGNGGGPYANTNNTNFGVNVDLATRRLSGFAWGENVGWINFSGGAQATPANPARLDVTDKRLRGFAWGENIGWINLDSTVASKFVAFLVPNICNDLDFNNDGIEQDPTDLEAFFNVYSGGLCLPVGAICDDIDFNNDGIPFDPTDLEAFFSVYSGGPCF